MKIAILDLGTNTFNLVIAQLQNACTFSIFYNDKISVKLGEGGINSNYILKAPFERGINAIQKHLTTCRKYQIDTIYAFATSAIRSSSNGLAFVKEVKEKFGLEIQVIDGNREAELIYEGVRLGLELNANKSLIMDIGGGSTEFIIASSNEIFWKHSFNLGAARLLEKFKPADPILKQEVESLELYFDEELSALDFALAKYQATELIGSSGSFDTFAEIITNQLYLPIDLEKNSVYEFNLNDFFQIHQQLIKSTKEERSNTPGIIEMRVDMIVVSSIFTNYILKKYALTKMRLSTYALKEGVIAELMNSKIKI